METHGTIVYVIDVYLNSKRNFFSKVIDPKVIDNSLLHLMQQTYKISGLFVIPTASNCKQCTDNG